MAYILKRQEKEGENCCGAKCPCWSVRELVIGWKVFSKIYDSLYGKLVCDYNLPLELPEVEKYEPSWDGTSPLSKVDSFVNIKIADNLNWKRETNTMPQWGWSCWYYLRFMDPKNENEIVDSNVVNYWWEVDSYVWWAEHAVLHLLYARFWHKFLFDIWIVPTDEPFYRLRNQWLILAHAFQRKNGWLLANDLVEEIPRAGGKYYEIETWDEVDRIISKMSKSLKNVINPDDIVEEYWADSLRLYEMYMAEFKDTAPWDTKSIIWVRRFIEKSERLFYSPPARGELEGGLPKKSTESDEFTMKLLHKTIKKIWEDIEHYKFNTAIAALMILVNNWLPNNQKLEKEFKEKFLILLSPFTPHLAEELWGRIWKKESIFFAIWPKYDKNMVIDDEIEIWIQILWKLRWTIKISKDLDKDEVLKQAKENESVAKWLEWKQIIKEIYVPWRIVNFVVK
jgi:leucyl-tRNA synthetase